MAAKAFKDKYGHNASFLETQRLVDNATRTVKMYAPKDVAMVTGAIRACLDLHGVDYQNIN